MVKSLLIAPHNDDETLFCSHAITGNDADLIVVYDSYVQPQRDSQGSRITIAADAITRRRETLAAVEIMSGRTTQVHFAGLSDAEDHTYQTVQQAILRQISIGKSYDRVYYPAHEPHGHDQHNLVAIAVSQIFDNLERVRYLSYTRTQGKSTLGMRVAMNGTQIRKKLRALASYVSQIEREECVEHFLRHQGEFIDVR